MTELPAEIAKKYRAIRILGEGGFGTVWEAQEVDTGRAVALKILAEKALSDADAVARFRHEALVASKISHPHVVSVLAAGVEGSHGYIALPLIQGCTLRDRIRHGPMPTGQVMLIAIALADALAEIHRQGVIHRDLKPENVLLENRERAMLTDFGISKSAGSSVQTREGIIFGTPGYVAPEQLEHEKASAASDQYSLGVIVFEMLAGRRPFSGDTPAEEAMARVKGPAPHIRTMVPRVDPGIAEVLMKMLSRRPQDRFKDMRTVQRALQVATMKMPAAEKDQVAARLPAIRVAEPGALPGPNGDTPVPKGASRAVNALSTVSMSRLKAARTPPRIQEPPTGSKLLWLAAGCAAVALGGAFSWYRFQMPSEIPAPPPLAVPALPPSAVKPPPAETPAPHREHREPKPPLAPLAPSEYPRIQQPDCARLEGPSGRITALDVARCEVKRWLAAWEKQAGHPVRGEFVPVVKEQKTPKDAQALLELFESAAASRVIQALAHLRDSPECAHPERFDAGLMILKARTAHAACTWAAFGSSLPRDEKFPFPKLFLPAAIDFYPQWDKLWKLVQNTGWEEQAAVLAEWIAFHRALAEERIDWPAQAPALPPNAGGSEDPGRLLARIWRLRVKRQSLQAFALWKPSRPIFEAELSPPGKQATLRAWAGLEGCQLSLFASDLAGANRAAAEARKALAEAADDPGARRLGLASWPEWRRMGSLGR